MQINTASRLPTIFGLIVALGAPLLPFTPILKILGNPPNLAARLLGQLFYLSIVIAVLLFVTLAEKRPLSSIGIKVPTWSTLFWAVIAAVVLVKGISPFSMLIVSKLGLPLFGKGLQTIVVLPVWFRLLAIVITGGIFEEVIYRGFAIERLAELTGSSALGAILALSAFAWMHYPLWGLGPVITFYISGGFLTALYLWKRDLCLIMLCHMIVDCVGLILAPPL
jgi:uncharacterized protein